MLLGLATIGSWSALAAGASAGSVSLRVERTGDRAHVTASGTFSQFPSVLLVYVHSGTGGCPGTSAAERERVERQGPDAARQLLKYTLGNSGMTSGPFSHAGFVLLKRPGWACAYLLPPRGVTRDPDDPPEATASAPIGQARPPACGRSPGDRIILRPPTRARGVRRSPLIVGEYVEAGLNRALPADCSVRWDVSGRRSDLAPPTVVRAYETLPEANAPKQKAIAPVPPEREAHALPSPVRPEPLEEPDLLGKRVRFYLTGAAAAAGRGRRTAYGGRANPGHVTVTATIERAGRQVGPPLRRTLAVVAPKVTATAEMCVLGLNGDTQDGRLFPPNLILGRNTRCRRRGAWIPGIRWVIEVTPLLGGREDVALNQLITAKAVTQGGQPCETYYHATPESPVSDPTPEGAYPPNGEVDRTEDPITLRAEDSPSITLGPYDPGVYGSDKGMPVGFTRTYAQEFEDRVMYRPPRGIWVSLRRMTWGFSGVVTRVGETGRLSDFQLSGPPERHRTAWSPPTTDADAGRLPHWNQFSGPVMGLVTCP